MPGVPEVSPEKNEPGREAFLNAGQKDGDDSSEENKQRLSDRAVWILLAISVVALVLWWTCYLWLSWAGLSRG